MSAYIPQKPSRSCFLPIRTLRYHVREWGAPDAPLLVFLHGWMDVSASFQFIVDALAREWHVISPDWRGFGLTASPGQDTFWLPDYQADLDALLDHYSPGVPVNLLGHSLGGNIVSLYAGVRPHRVRRAINLEGAGMPGNSAERAPARMAEWLDHVRTPPRLSTYPDLAAVAHRLCKNDPWLKADRAAFLAEYWSRPNAEGHFELQFHPAHKMVNPYLYRVDEVTATFAAITAPLLWVMSRDSERTQKVQRVPGYARRLEAIRTLEQVWVEGAGHMIHHDLPEQMAALTEDFFLRTDR